MFDKQKYDSEYVKENYYRVNLLLPKDYREFISIAAEKEGLSRNAFIKAAIEAKLEKLDL